jgi:hypothetical protein
MNSFNPDQNPHILSSPESSEGGGVSNQSSVPQTSVPQTESEIMSPAELIAELVGENLEGEAISEGGEGVDTEVPEDSLAAELDSLVRQEGEASKPKFEVNEDGLSLQGLEIQDIKSQIQQLESGEGEVLDAIQNKTLESRQKTRISLEDKKIKLEERQLQLSQMIAQAYGELKQLNPDTKKTFEEFTEEAKNLPTYRKRVSANEEALQEVESEITAFDAETKALVDTAIQKRLGYLQEELKEAQTNYTEIGAEENDKTIVFERRLKDNLTSTDVLFSNRTIQQVFDTYGLQEGLKRLQQLRTESNEAREKAAKAKIQTDIISLVGWYAQIPDLAQALDQDIEAKLQTLQQQNPDSDTVSEALSRDGTDRLRYLINSGDSQLQELAFWFSKNNKTEAEILAEHQNFAKYVKQQTEKRYKEEQQEQRYYLRQGQGHISMIVSEAEKQLQKDIDINIKEQFNRAKTDKLETLRRELKNLQLDEYGRPFDRLDQSMSSVRDNLRQDEIDNFQAELAQALQSGKITVNRGSFNRIDISGDIEEMNSKLQNIESTINSLVQNNEKISIEFRDRLKSIIQVSRYDKEKINETIKEKIKKISDKKRFKLLGIGRKQIEDLINLQQGIESELTKYTTLKSKQQEKLSENELDRENSVNLQQAYNKLPQSIRDTLSALANPSLATITQAITSGVEEIQKYQTPPEITERREQITSLESQIAETKAITAPTT